MSGLVPCGLAVEGAQELVAVGAGVRCGHAGVHAVWDQAAAERANQAEQQGEEVGPGRGDVLDVRGDVVAAVRADHPGGLGAHGSGLHDDGLLGAVGRRGDREAGGGGRAGVRS